MTEHARIAGQRARVTAARARQQLGWHGLTGLACLVMAGLLVAHQMLYLPLSAAQVQVPASQPAVAPIDASSTATAPTPLLRELASPAAISPHLLEIRRVVLDHGLNWPAAEFGLHPAAADAPARLEIRLTLTGSYLRLRHTLLQLMQEIPGLTIREMSMVRPTSDTTEVDAKLLLALLLEAESPAQTVKAKAPR